MMRNPAGGTDPGPNQQQNGWPDDRRKSCRIRLRDARGTLCWDDGHGPVTCEVEALNISGGGAAVLAERPPPLGLPVSLRLKARSTFFEAIEARALAASLDPSGRFFVRFQFTHWVALDPILEHFRERRLWERFPARENRAKLTWFELGLEKVFRGELLNISGGGAAIVIDAAPPADDPIWFELEVEGDVLEPVESRLVVTSLEPSGLQIVRIKFIDACSVALFELATQGRA